MGVCGFCLFDFFEGVVDGAGEVAFEASERFSVAFAFGAFAGEVGACGWVAACLGDRDSVECAVELSVAVPVEAMALVAAGGGVERGCACVFGELGFGGEAVDASDLGEELGRG